MKNFSNDKWNEALQKNDWNQINETKDLDEKVKIFNSFITKSLDEVAPFCIITVRSNHKFGLSEDTKDLMKKRDAARKMISKVELGQKALWNEKYKKLRNVVTSRIRKGYYYYYY